MLPVATAALLIKMSPVLGALCHYAARLERGLS
jgi:hypothetical protein